MKPEEVKTLQLITIEQLLEMQINEVPFTIVDSLPRESYEEGHIPGAVNIPSDDIARKANDLLDKNGTIITYCANYVCDASTVAARKLIDLGYQRVLDFKAGKKAWKDAGFELES